MTAKIVNQASSESTLMGGTLSPEYILKLKGDVEELRKQWSELPALIEKKQKLYEAALMFAPPDFDPEAPIVPPINVVASGEVVEDEERGVEASSTSNAPEEFTLSSPVEKHSEKVSWVSALRETLTISGKGMPHQELLAFVRQNYPSLPVSTGEKGFYNAISRLSDRKQIVKHGGLLYAASVVQDMEARGEKLPDTPEHQHRRGGSGEIVLEVLRLAPKGLSGPDLRKLVSSIPSAPKSLREHGQYIYNILATLIGTGAVVKEEGIYKLAKGDAKTPKGENPVAAGLSVATELGGSNL